MSEDEIKAREEDIMRIQKENLESHFDLGDDGQDGIEEGAFNLEKEQELLVSEEELDAPVDENPFGEIVDDEATDVFDVTHEAEVSVDDFYEQNIDGGGSSEQTFDETFVEEDAVMAGIDESQDFAEDDFYALPDDESDDELAADKEHVVIEADEQRPKAKNKKKKGGKKGKGGNKLLKFALIGAGILVFSVVGGVVYTLKFAPKQAAMRHDVSHNMQLSTPTILERPALAPEEAQDWADFEQGVEQDLGDEYETNLSDVNDFEDEYDDHFDVFDSSLTSKNEDLDLIDPVEEGPLLYGSFDADLRGQTERSNTPNQPLVHHDERQHSDPIVEFEEQVNFIADALLELTERVEKNAESIKSLDEKTQDHEKRISALEKKIESEGAAKSESKPAPKAQPKPKAEPKPAPKAESKPKAAPKPAPKKVAAPAPTSSLSKYKMIGVYPSSSSGVAPQLAWVMDGERLIEVSVGSTFDGLRVTRIENNTVYTNRGAIR